jgi:hypothetical protein
VILEIPYLLQFWATGAVFFIKIVGDARHQWTMPAILATQETEIRRTEI